MKNSALYAAKVKKLLSGAKDGKILEFPDRITLMVRAILEEDALTRHADEAVKGLTEEFVNINELRVSPVKDIVEVVGRRLPGSRVKAETLTGALNAIFEHSNTLSMDYLQNKPKREIRRALREELGLSPYAEAMVTLYGFAGHAMPVDHLLLEALKLEGHIHAHSDLEDLQGFLERIVLNKDAVWAHQALRAHAMSNFSKVEKAVQKKVEEAQRARAAARQAARAANLPKMELDERELEAEEADADAPVEEIELVEMEEPKPAAKPAAKAKSDKSAKPLKAARKPAKPAKPGKETKAAKKNK